MRKKIVAANWKMNFSCHEAHAYFASLNEMQNNFPEDVEVIIFPPVLYIKEFSKMAGNNSRFSVGAQNCSSFNEGAFTGELSANMIKSVGAKYCLVGHSERRLLFLESDKEVNLKIQQAIKVSLNVILCCGETLESRENNLHFKMVEDQLVNALSEINEEGLKKIVIAYEPVWAIGTGKTASAIQAQEMHAFIREQIKKMYSTEAANNIKILYGGSCNPENAAELFSGKDVDGGLIGGASLKAATFVPIIKAASSQ